MFFKHALEIILCDYINIAGLYSDNDSQKILEMLTLLTPTQKKYLLENMRLILNLYPDI